MEFHFCNPCDKSFNGRRPYNDHLASEKHKKKMSKIQLSTTVVDSPSNIPSHQYSSPSSALGSSLPFSDPFIIERQKSYWCNICKLYLNGPEQVKGHVNGSKHLKLKLSQPANSKMDIDSEIPKINLSNMKLNNGPKSIVDSYSDFKFSFHGASIENVLEDVKVFGPNDPIEF